MQTSARKNRARRDKKLYGYYQKLMGQPGAMYTACVAEVMKKSGLSQSTVKSIIKRESAPLV